MKIVVVGTGYVGLACVGFVTLGHEVVGYDIDAAKIDRLNRGEMPIVEPGLLELIEEGKRNRQLTFTTDLGSALSGADVCFVCVGTPALSDGNADLQFVDAAVTAVNAAKDEGTIVVIKSTVPVGTCRRLGTASNPEFLREGRALQDFLHPDRIVIGADDETTRLKLLQVYAAVDAPKLTMSPESSELTKYAANGFLATKISFANEIANICDRVGANVLDVTQAIGLDPRIGPQFLNAGIGYGGSCFPKDTSALRQIAGDAQIEFKLLDAVIEANNRQRERFVEKLGDVDGKHLAVWGLAFKAGTDDVRESAAIDVIERLLQAGATITAHDPLAMPNAKAILGNRINYGTTPGVVLEGADALLVLTEWPEFREAVASMPPIKIFDGRNVLADLNLPNYVGVGLGAPRK